MVINNIINHQILSNCMANRAKKCHEGLWPWALQYEYPIYWTEEEYTVTLLSGSMVHLYKERCICYGCAKQFKQNKENHKFQSRWKCKLPKEVIISTN